jgi:HemY protein
MLAPGADLAERLCIKLVTVLETGLDSLDAPWLARIEAAQSSRLHDARLAYLAGMACLSRQLWGKARQLLEQAAPALQDATLQRNAWRTLAVLAEQRGDEAAAGEAYKQAAQP